MKILALDLGTKTGVAYLDNYGCFRSGTKVLATAKELREAKSRRLDRRGDIRVIRFFDWLVALNADCKFDAVVFEDVQFSSSTMQTQLWSSFRTTVWLAFPKTMVECVPVGTLKKFATGSGAANKQQMGYALVRRDAGFMVGKHKGNFSVFTTGPTCLAVDDNQVDAIWLYKWAEQNLSRTTL